jgi:ankyrin repeat protein
MGGRVDVLKLLLDKGAEVNVKSRDGVTAIHLALFGDMPAQGARLRSMVTPAPEEGSYDKVIKLLLDAKADLNGPINGTPILMLVALGGKPERVKQLLDAGADVNAVGESRITALMGAAAGGNPETVKLLLEHGAKVDAKGPQDMTALMAAAEAGKADAVKLLLQHGADRKLKSDKGETALDVAKKKGHQDVVALLQH